MAAYTTPGKVRAALTGSETPQDGTPGEMPDSVLASEIDTAQAQVDAMLSARYAVPFAEGQAPALVVWITVAYACWHATLTYRRGVPLDRDEPVALRFTEAKAMLDRISKGTADLQLDADADGDPDVSSGAGFGRAINTVPAMFGLGDFGLYAMVDDDVRWRR